MRSARFVKLAMVLVVVLVGAGALALARSGGQDGDFHGAPVPQLFSDAQIRAVDGPVRTAVARGHRMARVWLDAHPVTTDTAFAAWAVKAVGAPPHDPGELARLKAIAAT